MGLFARILDRVDRQATLMGGMMDRLKVNLMAGGGDPTGVGIGRAVRACAFCRHGEQCQAWQDAHAEGAEQAPDFCPNAAFWATRR